MQIGIKLWSTNNFYIASVLSLKEKGYFDFIELYVVGNDDTGQTVTQWECLGVPFLVHAPHFHDGFNPAERSLWKHNQALFARAQFFADRLHSPYIIVHGGVLGDELSVSEQLVRLGDSRIILENQPYRSLDGNICAVSSPNEMRRCMKEGGVGACLDITHAVEYALSTAQKYSDVINDFLNLEPKVIHLSGVDRFAHRDRHLHFKESTIDMKEILGLMRNKMPQFCTVETPKDSEAELETTKEDLIFLRSLLS